MNNKTPNSSRREFLKKSGSLVAAAGIGALLGGTAPVFALPQSPQQQGSKALQAQRKALVFIMLDGGNDSYNMLVPTSDRHYAEYQQSRSNLALDRQTLLALNTEDSEGRHFGLHPSMPEAAQLFNQGDLAFIANIGPMIAPVTKQGFYQGAPLPLGLLSHADQFKHWQTSRPHQRINSGWFGYFADTLQANRPARQIPMNISLAGSNIMQNGLQASQYSITAQGSVGLVVNEEQNELNKVLLNSFERLLNTQASDPFSQTYLSQTREAQLQHEVFQQATANVAVPVTFSSTPLSQQLRKVAQSIKAADTLNHQQQTFFIRYIGWDHHDELLNNHANMLGVLSKALGEFQAALQHMGIADKTVTFTGSDFGRTLTSNGNGTDHGWGGNTLVMGEPVAGGQIFGQYPALSLGEQNPLDVGDGVLIPTTATDQLYAELAVWFGASPSEVHNLFPNLSNFTGNSYQPLGIIKTA